MRVTATLLGATTALVACADAWAQSRPTASLEYVRDARATERCPDETAVRRAVGTRLGYDPFDAVASTHVRAAIEHAGRGLRATISVQRADGAQRPRQIASAAGDCDELARAMALAISIAIDPLVLTRADTPGDGTTAPTTQDSAADTGRATAATTSGSTETRPATTPTRAATVPTARVPLRPTTRAPTSARALPPDRIRFRVGLGVGGEIGFAPALEPTAHFVVGARIRHFGVDLELHGALPATTLASGGTVSVTHAGATVLACAHDVPVPWLTGCGLVSLGALVGSGAQYATSQTGAVGPLIGLGGRLGVEIPLGRIVALTAHAEIAWVPTRGSFVVLGPPPDARPATAFTTPGYDVAAALGVLAHFR